MHERDAIRADDLLERGAGGFKQTRLGMRAARIIVKLADEVSEDLGIGLRTEQVPGLHQRRAERLVILDHAVVDECEPTGLVEVRVGVDVIGLAMGGPAGVTDTDVAGDRVFLDQVGQRLDAALAFAGFDAAGVDRGQSGGVVAAIFQPAQSIEENGSRRRFADVTDDAAHRCAERRANLPRKQGTAGDGWRGLYRLWSDTRKVNAEAQRCAEDRRERRGGKKRIQLSLALLASVLRESLRTSAPLR